MPDAIDPARQRRTAAMTVSGATRRTAAQGGRGAHAADRRTQARLVRQCSAQRAVQAPPQHSQPKQRPTTTKQNPLPRADGNGTPTANRLAPTTAPRGGESCASHRRVRRRPYASGAQKMGVPPRREKGVGEAARHWMAPPGRDGVARGGIVVRVVELAPRGRAWPADPAVLPCTPTEGRVKADGYSTVVCRSASAVVQWHASTRFTVMGF